MVESRRSMLVGGVFALELSTHPAPPPFVDPQAVAFVNARSALHTLLRHLSPRTLWLPSYLCEAVVVAAHGLCALEFYDVGGDLRVRAGRWLERVRQGDAVLVIDYFGFRRWVPIATALRERGAAIIEDAAQALFLTRAPEADFIIYSPRKFVGVADGGILRARASPPPHAEATPPLQWWLKAFGARLLRGEYDRGGASRRWFDLFQESEREAPVGPYRISDMSLAQLCYAIDYGHVQRRRVANYRVLADVLSDLAVYPDLDEGVVPLGFPVRVPERHRVCEALYREDIYPPVHWSIRGVVPDEFTDSHRLAAEALTIPCDQRYDATTMGRTAAAVRRALGPA